MPFYKFYVILTDNSLHTGIRELLDQYDLERVWRTYEAISRKKYGHQLKCFKVVHLCKIDPEVREFLAKRGKTKEDSPLDYIPEGMAIKAQSRKDSYSKNSPDWSKRKID